MDEKIKWRHPLLEQPKEGQAVYAINWHWKQQRCSFWIEAGYYQVSNDGSSARLNENDEHGSGAYGMDWPMSESELDDCNKVGAWIPVEEINIPEWLRNK